MQSVVCLDQGRSAVIIPCITGIAQSWEVASGTPGLAIAMLSKGKGFGNWLRLLGRHHTRAHWTRVYDLEQGRGSTAPRPSSTSCRTKERRNRFRPRPRRPPRRLRLRGRTASPARTTWQARNATGRLRRPLRRRATSTGRPSPSSISGRPTATTTINGSRSAWAGGSG